MFGSIVVEVVRRDNASNCRRVGRCGGDKTPGQRQGGGGNVNVEVPCLRYRVHVRLRYLALRLPQRRIQVHLSGVQGPSSSSNSTSLLGRHGRELPMEDSTESLSTPGCIGIALHLQLTGQRVSALTQLITRYLTRPD